MTYQAPEEHKITSQYKTIEVGFEFGSIDKNGKRSRHIVTKVLWTSSCRSVLVNGTLMYNWTHEVEAVEK